MTTATTTVSTPETKIVTSLTARVLGFDIVYELNAPHDGGNISEDFDKADRIATCGIADILSEESKNIIPGIIISTLRDYAKVQKMDYLQKLTINGEKCWCIDNGEYITLMTPSEY